MNASKLQPQREPVCDRSHLAAELVRPRVLSRALEQAGMRPEGASPLTLERGWPLPKIPLMLRYADPEVTGKRGRWWSVYLLFGGKPPFVYRSAVKRRQALVLGDLGVVVQRFPNDAMLTRAAEAISSRTALDPVATGLGSGRHSWDRLTAQVLSYKPSRRLTIRYRLTAPTARGVTVFGKSLPAGEDESAANVLGALESAARRDRFERLRIPTLAGRVPKWNMLLWKRVSGRSVFELLETSELTDAARVAGMCLAELHRSSTRWNKLHDRRRELDTLQAWISAATLGVPGLGSTLSSTLSSLTRTSHTLPEASLVPSHRDFYDKQLVVHDGTGTVLDLETASQAEPELDVANFLAHLELRQFQGRTHEFRDATEAFVNGYSTRVPGVDERRLDWYLASSLLRLACVYSFRPGRVGLSRTLSDAAQRTAAAFQSRQR
jgi:hypothetical protein